MPLPLTKIEGVPDKLNDTRPGMAYFVGTGPQGRTCGDCKFRGYKRESRKGTFYHTGSCRKFLEQSKRHGPEVNRHNPSCKYFEAKADGSPYRST